MYISKKFKHKTIGELIVTGFDKLNLNWILKDSNNIEHLLKVDKIPKSIAHIRVGEKFKTNQGICIIVEYFGTYNITLCFDNKNFVTNKHYKHLKNGNIQNPYFKSIYNIGYLGKGNFNQKLNLKIYSTWIGMLQRCYSKESLIKYPSYIGCSVYEKWLNFQVFSEWFENNYIEGFHLDKDILIKGNKIYSPETCCFVPHEINSLFIKSNSLRGNLPIGVSLSKNKQKYISKISNSDNQSKQIHIGVYDTIEEAFLAYKFEKEKYIKEIAIIWKDEISEQVYQVLYNYKVEITD